jgi:uncharacterized membrane protein
MSSILIGIMITIGCISAMIYAIYRIIKGFVFMIKGTGRKVKRRFVKGA